jgi:hypothetical protein
VVQQAEEAESGREINDGGRYPAADAYGRERKLAF